MWHCLYTVSPDQPYSALLSVGTASCLCARLRSYILFYCHIINAVVNGCSSTPWLETVENGEVKTFFLADNGPDLFHRAAWV